MISYFGQTILTASESLTNKAYSSSWYMASHTFRKTLIILMLQLQRETKLCAGRVFPINLDLFTTVIIENIKQDEIDVNIELNFGKFQIMKFSYRLYAVLQ